ncbi:hypothetical protein [Spirochaeta africana]|uniref:Uncharacterized protein n=1 Tax=Spirochaeta africana (strain ATCC 700263 / DSM 8902 / Z-7692) TaxID=889378 RepID=H9ULF7_SPIAZ|nr:hypothetical protein [Spirochaeta africana]AFG38350.1 hypothetical protein Spiaf_2318 [Spirochaeta africana DSM 8902]
MHTRTLIIALAIGLIAVSGSWARSPGTGSPETVGSEAAAAGSTVTLAGTLELSECAWELHTTDAVYRIMLGRFGRNSELPLAEGEEARIHGFVQAAAIAPITLTIADQEYQLWNEDGRPGWARSSQAHRALQQDRAGHPRMQPERGVSRRDADSRQPRDRRQPAPEVQERGPRGR